MSEQDFQTYKTVAIFASLITIGCLQLIIPYQVGLRALMRQWRTNFLLAGLNIILAAAMCQGCVVFVTARMATAGFGLLHMLHLPAWLNIAASVVALDFLAYTWHWCNHRAPLLWRFHAVHHSERLLDMSTAFRFHPGEVLPGLALRLVVIAILGLPLTGILAFEVVYAFCNQFVHGNLRLNKGFEKQLGLLFVTPTLHRTHHSEELNELNRNFGTIFSVWDRLFRTFMRSPSAKPSTVGLKDRSSNSIVELILMPFKRH